MAAIATGLADLSAPVVVAFAVIPSGLGVGAYVHERIERRNQEREEQARLAAVAAAKDKDRIREIEGVVTWPLPLVVEADPFDFGVHRPLLSGGRTGQLGPYVARDVDQRADEALGKNGVLLLIGAPGSGVSRTAWELATRLTMNRRLLAPVPGRLEDAYQLEVFSRMKGSHLVLWLDRIDKHTDLTADLLKRCQKASSGLRVIATISTRDYDAWAAEHDDLAEHPAVRQVRVEQLLSSAERGRAAAAYPGLDVTSGIGAAFTGLRSLLKKEQAGDNECPFEPVGANCAIARTVVHAACFWPITGTPRPLTLQVLTDAVTRRLQLPAPIERAHLEHALTWATKPVTEDVSMLSLHTTEDGTQSVVAHQGLAEAVTTQDAPDPTVWLTALNDAHAAGDSDTVGRIGYHAHRARLFDIATTAWSEIVSFEDPAVKWIGRAAALSEAQHDPIHQLPPLIRLMVLVEQDTELEHHEEIAYTMTSLGNAWLKLGQYEKALELHERVLALKEQKYGRDDLEVARTLGNLGNAWLKLGQADKAREFFEHALAIEERAYGSDHVEVARTLGNLGNALLRLEQYETALDLHVRALAIEERAYGPDHVELARTLGNLGGFWLESGQAEKARVFLERALAIEERAYGPDNVEVAVTLGNLGGLWLKLGKAEKARVFLERALTIKERRYGKEDVEVARTLTNLGLAWLMSLGKSSARAVRSRHSSGLP